MLLATYLAVDAAGFGALLGARPDLAFQAIVAETSWAELIDRIDDALARLGVHCGNTTIN